MYLMRGTAHGGRGYTGDPSVHEEELHRLWGGGLRLVRAAVDARFGEGVVVTLEEVGEFRLV